MRMSYREFLDSKREVPAMTGVEVNPSTLNSRLFPWQRDVVVWALRRGRAALFEDCGLGKTLQQLEWSAALWRLHSKPALVLCPVAVAEQTAREAKKFCIDAPVAVVKSGSEVINGINITNYEKLIAERGFDPSVFNSIVLDESSILKSYAGTIKRFLCDSFARTPHRLACTATPAPNDHMELGNHSQFLGILESSEMLARWFINDTMKTGGYRLRNHGRQDFWNWIASWAAAISKPSDIGHSDEGYELPEMVIHEHVVESQRASDRLFAASETLNVTTALEEKRASIVNKAKVVADLVNGNDEPWAVWVDTNYEADAIRPLIADAVEVRGSDSESNKASRLLEFSEGRARVIITKPEIGGFGMNWQHCCNTTYFAGFSFERWYQSIRRLWRFGQKRPVNVHLVMSEGEHSVASVLRRKQQDFSAMAGEMSAAMREGMMDSLFGRRELKKSSGVKPVVTPNWLSN